MLFYIARKLRSRYCMLLSTWVKTAGLQFSQIIVRLNYAFVGYCFHPQNMISLVLYSEYRRIINVIKEQYFVFLIVFLNTEIHNT